MSRGKSSLSLSLSLRSICWKKMSQTPLKVIGLDHHYTFYSMSWGRLGHFCWKIHLFEKIHFIQCSRTKRQSSEPATPPAGAIPSFCHRYIPVLSMQPDLRYVETSEGGQLKKGSRQNRHNFFFVTFPLLLSTPVSYSILYVEPCYFLLPGFSKPYAITLHASLIFARSSTPFFPLSLSRDQSHDLWLCWVIKMISYLNSCVLTHTGVIAYLLQILLYILRLSYP